MPRRVVLIAVLVVVVVVVVVLRVAAPSPPQEDKSLAQPKGNNARAQRHACALKEQRPSNKTTVPTHRRNNGNESWPFWRRWSPQAHPGNRGSRMPTQPRGGKTVLRHCSGWCRQATTSSNGPTAALIFLCGTRGDDDGAGTITVIIIILLWRVGTQQPWRITSSGIAAAAAAVAAAEAAAELQTRRTSLKRT